jgi:hypothetical protein
MPGIFCRKQRVHGKNNTAFKKVLVKVPTEYLQNVPWVDRHIPPNNSTVLGSRAEIVNVSETSHEWNTGTRVSSKEPSIREDDTPFPPRRIILEGMQREREGSQPLWLQFPRCSQQPDSSALRAACSLPGADGNILLFQTSQPNADLSILHKMKRTSSPFLVR